MQIMSISNIEPLETKYLHFTVKSIKSLKFPYRTGYLHPESIWILAQRHVPLQQMKVKTTSLTCTVTLMYQETFKLENYVEAEYISDWRSFISLCLCSDKKKLERRF